MKTKTKTKTNIIGIFKNTKLLGSIIAVVGFGIGTYAFNGPPVGCTPESCPNGPLAELKAENIKEGVVIGGLTGSLADSLLACTVENEPDLIAENIKDGVEIFGVTGTLGASVSCGDSISYEGQVYETVLIGEQCWFAENLNVGTKLASGSTEPYNNGTIEKWCYDNSDSMCDTYGGLYSWDELMGYTTTEGAQGICPSGWHIPTDAEFHTLESYYATGICDADREDWGCDPAGTALQLGGSSGFDFLLAGQRRPIGSIDNLDNFGQIWTSTESTTEAWQYYFGADNSEIRRRGTFGKENAFSMRCIQD